MISTDMLLFLKVLVEELLEGFQDLGVVDFLIYLKICLVWEVVLKEDQQHEDDQRSLNDEVVAQRKAQEGEGVQILGEPGQYEGENEPDGQHQYGEVPGLYPMTQPSVLIVVRHGIPRFDYIIYPTTQAQVADDWDQAEIVQKRVAL